MKEPNKDDLAEMAARAWADPDEFELFLSHFVAPPGFHKHRAYPPAYASNTLQGGVGQSETSADPSMRQLLVRNGQPGCHMPTPAWMLSRPFNSSYWSSALTSAKCSGCGDEGRNLRSRLDRKPRDTRDDRLAARDTADSGRCRAG
jgi:hypothetical protein